MRRYLSLLIGIAAILGSAYFLAMGLFAGVVIFFWAGKASPLALIVLLAATMVTRKWLRSCLPAEQMSTRHHYSQRRGKAGIPP